jgi:hypothetical protein
MSEEDPFFIIRENAVWACWLDSRPAVKLGGASEVLLAMEQFLADTGHDPKTGEPASIIRPPPPAAPPPPTAPPPPPPPPPPPAPQSAPPPSQAIRTKDDRLELRHEISVIGRVGSGIRGRDLTVRDLSEGGCRFYDPLSQYPVGSRITIRLGPIGPIWATVRWCRDEQVGIQFDNPLYPSVLEHIRQHFDLRG